MRVFFMRTDTKDSRVEGQLECEVAIAPYSRLEVIRVPCSILANTLHAVLTSAGSSHGKGVKWLQALLKSLHPFSRCPPDS